MHFLLEYFKHPRRIGAVAPSGVRLANKMMQGIDFDKARVIVEYGPGTGSFTRELVARRRPGTVLLLIEQNGQFCSYLTDAYGQERDLHIIHGNAEKVNAYLKQYGLAQADYIVSGLPFASLPTAVSDAILTATKTALGERGQFITFQYTLVKRKFFERYFRITGCLREMRNLPPAYVFVMMN